MRKGSELTNLEEGRERLRTLGEHPELPQLLAHTPAVDVPGDEPRISRGFMVMTVVSIVAVGAVATGLLLLFCAPLAVVPIALGIAGLYALVRHMADDGARGRQPLRRVPCLVIDESTRIENASSAGTTYAVTLEAKDGSTLECTALESVRGTATTGDVGVAFLKNDTLLEFARLASPGV